MHAMFGDKDIWPICSWIVQTLPEYEQILKLIEFSGAKACTREYFQKLAVRRSLMMAFTKDRLLGVTFLGINHLKGNDTAAEKLAVQASQALAWQHVQELKGNVFMLEKSNNFFGDAPLTKKIILAVLQKDLERQLAEKRDPRLSLRPGAAQIFFDRSWDIHVRTMGSGELVYAGEEWPLQAEWEMRAYRRNALGHLPDDDERVQRLFGLIMWFAHLRSEIIVIRTLETLMRTNRYRAVIIQGANHDKDMQALADLYSFDLEIMSTVTNR